MSRSTKSAAAERAVKATTSRHISLLWPFVIWIGLWVIAEGMYLVFHYLLPEYLVFVAIFATIALGTLCVAVYWHARSRIGDRKDSHAIRGLIYATVTAVASSLWFLFGMAGNPLSPGLMVAWGFGLIVVVSWIIRMVMERTDAQAHVDGRPSRRGAAQQLIASITGDPEIEATVARSTPEMIDIQVDVTESSLDRAALRGMGEKVAAAVGVPAHSGVIIPDAQHAGLVTARVMLKDILAEPLTWPGPTAPGGTPFSPIEKGRYITGEPARVYIADRDGTRHTCRVGAPGSGKGNGSLLEIANAITWQNTTVTVIDIRKSLATVEPLIPAIDWAVTDRDSARALLTAGIDRVLEARFRLLSGLGAKLGTTVWQPGCGLNFWWIQVEEASFLELPDEYVEKIGKSARSAGLHLEWSLQSSYHGEMSTTLRRMFTLWEVYGCQDDFETKNLPDELVQAGADPSKWRDEMPGMNYLSGKGIPRTQQITELRDFLPTRDQLREVALQWGAQPLDQFTADLLGTLYANRPSPVKLLEIEQQRARTFVSTGSAGAPRAAGASPVGANPPSSPGTSDAVPQPSMPMSDEQDGKPTEFEQMTAEELGVTTPYEGREMDLSDQDVRDLPLREAPDVPLGDDPPTQTPPGWRPDEESVRWMREQVDGYLDLWESEGRVWVRPADFVDTPLCGALGPQTRSRAYFAKEIKERLVPAGRLVLDPVTSKYQIIPKATVPAAAKQ